MDSLLELSDAAEVAAPRPPAVSGFERTAAALLDPHGFSQPNPDGHPFGTPRPPSSPLSSSLLTEDLDLLIDRELATLTEQRGVKDEPPGSASSAAFPPPPVPQQRLPELLQSSVEAACRERPPTQPSLSGGSAEELSGAPSPLNELSTWGDVVPEARRDVLDFTHLTTESFPDGSKPPLDLAASGRPSAFQLYKKPDPPNPDLPAPTYPDSSITGARSKVGLLSSHPHGHMLPPWNLAAPEFCPQRPAFITPVAQAPSCWLSPSRHASPWLNWGPVSQAPLKPSATVPKSWAPSAAPQAPAPYGRLQLQGKVLVLLRGAPGSGKSTLARALLEHNPGGVVLSTDDYFSHGTGYQFDPTALGEAHEWNHKRGFFESHDSRLCCDKESAESWSALRHGYKVLFREPDTWWKFKARELERRTTHNVPVDTIRRMLNGYERFVTVQSIMGSHTPDSKQAVLQESHHRGEEVPVAFSESIAQRVRRVRSGRRSGLNQTEAADLVKDTDDKEALQDEQPEEEEAARNGDEEKSEMLHFVGDWPCGRSLQQRPARRAERRLEMQVKETGDDDDDDDDEKAEVVTSGPDITEFQKLLDLIQTGGVTDQAASWRSLSSGEESEKEADVHARSGKDRQPDKSQAVLPDCVQDWKLGESRTGPDGREGVGGENGARADAEGDAGEEATESADVCGSGAKGGDARLRGHLSPVTPEAVTKQVDSAASELPPETESCVSSQEKNTETGCLTQTEPQDFALLWRLNRLHGSGGPAAGGPAPDVRVLEGNSSRFAPASAAPGVCSSGHADVPYRVVHEKGTQVEEKEVRVSRDRLESLRILSRHFKLVSFDTLEDLYDKCSGDLEWSTNLLLDSGERFFREEDCEGGPVQSGAAYCLEPVNEPEGEDSGAGGEAQESACGTGDGSDGGDRSSNAFESAPAPASDPAQPPQAETCPPDAAEPLQQSADADRPAPQADLECGAWGEGVDGGAYVLHFEDETADDSASMDEINRLLQAELEEMEREQGQRKAERRSQHLDIQSVELKLPTELALQLTELFGPVGVDPGNLPDDFDVQMDLNLAKLLHQKWKDTIQASLNPAATCADVPPVARPLTVHKCVSLFRKGKNKRLSPSNASARMPVMDHWNVSRPHVSLRDIIKEQQALEDIQSRVDLHRRDGATLLKEQQLYALFPTIDKHFLQDIFRDHNYSLTQTELFLRSLLNEEQPVKTVVAPEAPRTDLHRAASKERDKKPPEPAVAGYQDTEDPEYEDFRAEANLQRTRQLESFAKAAEAFRQGRKEVASFYAQQGYLHGQRMREANHRAAAHIFERVNSSLLPRNILDLHGLHVREALEHLAQVLEEKAAGKQGLCQPQLSVITGRGNHSLGGVARIRPAVIDYLTNKHYRQCFKVHLQSLRL
uniref:NEDD4 binding protein 2 n=1 Tax=Fundulus heteroclitus TaxID=8078 RepID=A0A3Q2QF29_FUNHE